MSRHTHPSGRHPQADTPLGRHTPQADTPGQTPPPPKTATAVDGTHPTGMHSSVFSFGTILVYFQFSPCTIFNFISLLCASFLFLYAAFLLDSVIINNERPFPQYRYNITTKPVSIFLSSGGSRISKGVKTYYLAKFSPKNCMKVKEIGLRPPGPPCGFANVSCQFSKNVSNEHRNNIPTSISKFCYIFFIYTCFHSKIFF